MASEALDAKAGKPGNGVLRTGLASVVALTCALLLIGLVVQLAVTNRNRDAALARERQSYEALIVIRGLDASLGRAEAALGRFVISGERRTGTAYYDEWRRGGQLLDRLRSLSARDRTAAATVEELARLYDERGDELAKPATRATYRQGWSALSQFNQAGESVTLPLITRALDRLSVRERQRLGELSRVAQAAVDESNQLTQTLSVLGVALVGAAILLGWLTLQAIGEQRAEERRADLEADRAGELDALVAERTKELRLANAALVAEARERAAAEAQLRQVQKMEAVGQLTGGIAHDFNNMLAVVVGGLDLARRRLGAQPDDAARHIDNAMEGATRAAALTKRLLAFARAEPLLPAGFEPAGLIADMSDLLERTLGERMSVTLTGPSAPWQVWCDPHGLENAVLNLAVNARDAMHEEGALTIDTANVTLVGREVGEAPAGDYVRVSVIDRGGGIPPEILDRVFEPFFTTKPVGKGTGLGLSQIFGFARQSGGEVAISSVVGEGTTVSIYLPRFVAIDEPVAVAEPVATAEFHEEGAAILVVEDDPRVRGATCEALEELGYTVAAVDGGEAALAELARGGDYRLVITDVIMPGMTGPQLAGRIAARHPGLGLLFVSGYVGEAGDADGFRDHELLRKPFTVAQLAKAVSGALGRTAPQRDEAA